MSFLEISCLEKDSDKFYLLSIMCGVGVGVGGDSRIPDKME